MSDFFWKGDLPTGWDVKRADSVLEYSKNSIRIDSIKGTTFFHYSIPSVQEIGDGKIEDGDEIESDKILLEGNELLVSKLNPEKGCVIISEPKSLPIICSTEFVPLKPKGNILLRYAFYIYSSEQAREHISSKSQSTTRSHKRVNPEDIAKIWFPFPPLPIQRQIAAYLDRETAHIDALIAAKERLLLLLAEKRQALITRAVTRGLDENVALKDSGVEWLGMVPEGWEVVKMKYLVSITGGGTPSKSNSEYWKGCIPWVSPKDMKSLFIDSTEDHISETALAESATKLVPVGSVLIVVRSGILRHTLPVGINTLPVALNQDMKALIPHPNRLRSAYLSLLLSGLQNQLLLEWVKQGTTVESVEMEFFANTYFPVPSLVDQELIVSYIQTQTTRLDALQQATTRSIGLLRERRSALIAAAVTGAVEL